MRALAGSFSMFLGLGFGLPCLFGLRHFARTGEVWTFMGFPTYGDGPFDRIGIPTSTPLLAASCERMASTFAAEADWGSNW